MTSSQSVLMTIEFPELSASQAAERINALRDFALREVDDLSFVETEQEGHLGVELAFAVMVGVPAASLLWRKYFSDFHPRRPGKVRVGFNGQTAFEGYAADPDQVPERLGKVRP